MFWKQIKECWEHHSQRKDRTGWSTCWKWLYDLTAEISVQRGSHFRGHHFSQEVVIKLPGYLGQWTQYISVTWRSRLNKLVLWPHEHLNARPVEGGAPALKSKLQFCGIPKSLIFLGEKKKKNKITTKSGFKLIFSTMQLNEVVLSIYGEQTSITCIFTLSFGVLASKSKLLAC